MWFHIADPNVFGTKAIVVVVADNVNTVTFSNFNYFIVVHILES